MENTLENKAKFFAQYINKRDCIARKGFKKRDNINPNGIDAFDILELTPLHLISDEDAIEVGKFWFEEENTLSKSIGLIIHWSKSDILDSWSSNIVDYLRSKSYALPYNGLSVEKMIEYGWVVLKTEI